MSNPCELAHTGATSGMLLAAAVAAFAVGAILVIAARRRGRAQVLAGTAALGAVVVGGLAFGVATPTSAAAADCPPAQTAGTATDPADPGDPAAPSGTPAGPGAAAPTDPPTPTPTNPGTPTDPPTPPEAASYLISGTYRKDGIGALVFTDPPGTYRDFPTQDGGTTWSLPTVPRESGPMAGVEVTLTMNGTTVATTTTDGDGRFAFGVEAPGDYVVSVTTLPTDHSGDWNYWIVPAHNGLFYHATPWSQPEPRSVTVTDGDVTGIDFLTTSSCDIMSAE